ncbi:MAG: PRC-barrel domain-containing protein [Rubrobacter sp.]|nr:PRC-barrel domain-containing protein [Rubrobacter sp.]MDQ3639728.1 PRC-barrel domain-containing protein [Actinomycetota bacterium]
MRNEATSRGGDHRRGDPPPAKEQGFGPAVLDDESGERLVTSTEFASYALHDPVGCEIGKVEKVLVNEDGGPEYVAVKIGSIWQKKTVLIPVESVSVDGGRQALILQ